MFKQISRMILPAIFPAIIMVSIAPPSFAASASADKFEDLNFLYRLTQVCYDTRKYQKSKYITPAELKETKASYTRQVASFGLSSAQKSAIQKTVSKSDEFTVMSRLIKTGNNWKPKRAAGVINWRLRCLNLGFSERSA